MTAAPTDDEIREMAKARVEFKGHALVYVVMNLFMAGIWWFTSDRDGSYWPMWAHLGWGVGLVFHAWGVYGNGRDWQKREEEKLRAKFGRS